MPLSDVRSICRHTPALGWQYAIVVLKSGLAYPPFYFYNGGVIEFLAKGRYSQCDLDYPEKASIEEDKVSEHHVPTDPLEIWSFLLRYYAYDSTYAEREYLRSTKKSEYETIKSQWKGTEGVAGLNVRVLECIASVELSKQTTVQATGVASSLVEAIQGAGFKLQTLNLSFDDEEDIIV